MVLMHQFIEVWLLNVSLNFLFDVVGISAGKSEFLNDQAGRIDRAVFTKRMQLSQSLTFAAVVWANENCHGCRSFN